MSGKIGAQKAATLWMLDSGLGDFLSIRGIRLKHLVKASAPKT